jgi:hypothetical protein
MDWIIIEVYAFGAFLSDLLPGVGHAAESDVLHGAGRLHELGVMAWEQVLGLMGEIVHDLSVFERHRAFSGH